MNYKTLIIAIVASSISVSALAGHSNKSYQKKQHFYDYAKVKSVTPIYETVELRIPREVCRSEKVSVNRHRSATPIILGSLIGAAIGNKLGHHKSNKRVGTVAGTILGAAIGSDISRRSNSHGDEYRIENRCHTRYDTEYQREIVAYDVSYRYRGNTFHTQTQNHPGKRLKVKLRLEPAVY